MKTADRYEVRKRFGRRQVHWVYWDGAEHVFGPFKSKAAARVWALRFDTELYRARKKS